ncbi:hypothetical protein [Streptomyces sp. NPDC047706]|uniref:hypothetical protein n=1 Tax=Streptomyces sp. NPDC047706 TaxID=3365486 RepID=UPI003721077A
MRGRLDRTEAGTRLLEEKSGKRYRALAEPHRAVDAPAMSTYERAEEADRRFAAEPGEATVDRLTDNQEVRRVGTATAGRSPDGRREPSTAMAGRPAEGGRLLCGHARLRRARSRYLACLQPRAAFRHS